MHFRVLKEAHIALIELLAGRSRRRARERIAVVVFFMPAHIALLYCYIGYICLSQYYIHSRRSKCVTIPRILLQIFHILGTQFRWPMTTTEERCTSHNHIKVLLEYCRQERYLVYQAVCIVNGKNIVLQLTAQLY